MTKKISYSQLALSAMCRAAKDAHKRAADHNLKMPVWKNDKIVYIDPNSFQDQNCK